MKCQILFSRKNKKNIISLSSVESAHCVKSANNFPSEILAADSPMSLFFAVSKYLVRANCACPNKIVHRCSLVSTFATHISLYYARAL